MVLSHPHSTMSAVDDIVVYKHPHALNVLQSTTELFYFSYKQRHKNKINGETSKNPCIGKVSVENLDARSGGLRL